MTKAERDPRWEPAAGDELRDAFGVDCRVVGTEGSVVTQLKYGRHSNVNLDYWRSWCRDATVVKKGGEG